MRNNDLRQLILNFCLNITAHISGSVLFGIGIFCYQAQCVVGHLQSNTALGKRRLQLFQLNVCNGNEIILIQVTEGDNAVHTVEKFGAQEGGKGTHGFFLG